MASNACYFVFPRGVYSAWCFSFSRGDTLRNNVGPREENPSNGSFGPGEEDTSQCR